jgi:hypothetical protein
LFEKPLVIDSCFDYGVNYSCHLGGNRRQRFAFAVAIKRIVRKVSFVFVTEGVLAHVNGAQTSHPENHSQPLVATLGQRLMPTALSGLGFTQVESAVVEELSMMAEATHVSGFSQNRQAHDGSNAWQRLKTTEVSIVGQELLRDRSSSCRCWFSWSCLVS